MRRGAADHGDHERCALELHSVTRFIAGRIVGSTDIVTRFIVGRKHASGGQ